MAQKLQLKKRTDRCFECGKTDGAMRAAVDAGKQQHWFHPACFKKFVGQWKGPPK